MVKASAEAVGRSSSVRLAFRSGQNVTAPLTWGQRSMWGPMRWFGEEANQFNIRWTLVPAKPVEQEQARAALGVLLEAHQATRSHYVKTEQGPRQQVFAEGCYDIALVRALTDPAAAAADLAESLAAAVFDHEAEWPLRCGWVLDGQDRVAAVALAGSHLAFDGWAMERFAAQLREQLEQVANAGSAHAMAPSGVADFWQPVDQAAYEQSPAGRRKGERVLRHWEERLLLTPASMFDLPAAPTGEYPMEKYRFESAAIVPAACAIAARTGTTVSNVLLSMSALILAAYNGHEVCTMKLIVGNRYEPRSRELIAITAQDGLLMVPIRDTDLLTAVRDIYRPGLAAYHRGQCDPFELDGLVQETARSRGVWFDLSAFFNDTRSSSDWPAAEDPALGRASLDRLRRDSRFWRSDRLGKGDMKYCVAVMDIGGGRCQLSLLADTAFLPPPLGEIVLRGIETLLCDAVVAEVGVREIANRIGLTPARRGPDWVRTETGWVRPQEVALTVRAAAGGAVTAVFAQDCAEQAGIYTLTAYVAADGREISPESLHSAVLGELPGKLGVAAPSQYVLCDGAPRGESPAGIEDWRSMPVLARGRGRSRG